MRMQDAPRARQSEIAAAHSMVLRIAPRLGHKIIVHSSRATFSDDFDYFLLVLSHNYPKHKNQKMSRDPTAFLTVLICQLDHGMVWEGGRRPKEAMCLRIKAKRGLLCIQQFAMATELSPKKRRYACILIQKRQRLIDMVLEEGKPINKAAKRLNIRYSTAKLIMKKYRETGRFFMKKKPTIVDLAEAEQSSGSEEPQQKHIEPLAIPTPCWNPWTMNPFMQYPFYCPPPFFA